MKLRKYQHPLTFVEIQSWQVAMRFLANRLQAFTCFALLAPLFCFAFNYPASSQELPDHHVKKFRLAGTDGSEIAFNRSSADRLTVDCFLGIECPLAKLYAPRLEALAKEYSDRKVQFIGINSNQQDSMEEFREFVAKQEITFPCGKDYDNIVADQWRVTRTPEVVVVDNQLETKYRGRIDDQYLPGVARSKPQREDLRCALEESKNQSPMQP